MTSTDILELVAAIPGADGWWSTSAHEKFQDLAAELLEMGVATERVADILSRAYWAASDEYGM